MAAYSALLMYPTEGCCCTGEMAALMHGAGVVDVEARSTLRTHQVARLAAEPCGCAATSTVLDPSARLRSDRAAILAR